MWGRGSALYKHNYKKKKFVGSESGQRPSVKPLQNMVSTTLPTREKIRVATAHKAGSKIPT
jgi:hypothetical protein